MTARKKTTTTDKPGRGGTREGAGRPPHPLGTGVKTSVMIPYRLLAAMQVEANQNGTSLSEVIISRLIRGKKRGQKL